MTLKMRRKEKRVKRTQTRKQSRELNLGLLLFMVVNKHPGSSMLPPSACIWTSRPSCTDWCGSNVMLRVQYATASCLRDCSCLGA